MGRRAGTSPRRRPTPGRPAVSVHKHHPLAVLRRNQVCILAALAAIVPVWVVILWTH